MAAQRDVQRSFRLSADLDAKLTAEAEKLGRSVSSVIVRSLEAALAGVQVARGQAVVRGAVEAHRKKDPLSARLERFK